MILNTRFRVGRPGTSAVPDVGRCSGNSTLLHVRPLPERSWHTQRGVYAKRSAIIKRGLPDATNWRFITLTINPDLFDSALQAYQSGKARLRVFSRLCRDAGIWMENTPWAWKLEFQANGYPHWHLFLAHPYKFTIEQLRMINFFWSYGRTNCKRLTKIEFNYAFKYVFKQVYQDDSDKNDILPTWFLDYYQTTNDKPKSFARVRFWQTSKGFYKNVQPCPIKGQPKFSILPYPVRDILTFKSQGAIIIATTAYGRYKCSARILLDITYSDFHHSACEATLSKNANVWQFDCCVPPKLLITRSCQLQRILHHNRLRRLIPLITSH